MLAVRLLPLLNQLILENLLAMGNTRRFCSSSDHRMPYFVCLWNLSPVQTPYGPDIST